MDKYDEANKAFGKCDTFCLAMEELSEAIKALNKNLRYPDLEKAMDIVEEFTDVLIMYRRVKRILFEEYGITDRMWEDMDQRKYKKMCDQIKAKQKEPMPYTVDELIAENIALRKELAKVRWMNE